MTQQYIVDQYIFDPVAQTIKMPQIPDLRIEGVQLITNLTTGALIYQFNNVALGGTVSGDVLELTFNTAAMNATDKLQILYNPPRGGFFDRALSLLYQAVEYLRSPPTLAKLPQGDYMRCVLDNTTSNISGVQSVASLSTMLNVGPLGSGLVDAREIVWTAWDTEYNTGVRNKII
jgi:hypothetical protein